MKKYAPHIGLLLMSAGTLVLISTRLHAFSDSNLLLLTGLACIVAGIVCHIRSIKRDSRY